MTSICLVLLSATLCVSAVLSCCDESLEQRSVHTTIIKTQQEKDLMEALQAVLEKLKTNSYQTPPRSSASYPLVMRVSSVQRVRGRGWANCVAAPGTTCDFFIMKCL